MTVETTTILQTILRPFHMMARNKGQNRYQFFLEVDPDHEFYEGNRPGAALLRTGSRRDKATLARFHSGHTEAQRPVAGHEVYPQLSTCNVT
ncbi:hypothetical protein TNCV_3184451 [Trichonephila clavipes]|nr:hypothetical protein TNCV_3184451 [Trichonephila clavipes]